MLTYTFENRGKKSYYQYLYEQMKEDILAGKLAAGTKLPSKRSFAKHLNLSVMTIENAYGQLLVEGYITSVEKKGYYVADITGQVQIPPKEPYQIPEKTDAKGESGAEKTSAAGAGNADDRSTGGKGNAAGDDVRGQQTDPVEKEKGSEEPFADFASNQVSSRHFPLSTWSKLMRRVLADQGTEILKTGSHQGLYALREAIARHLYRFRGMAVAPEQIVIGAGTEYLYQLLIQLLGRERIYGIENPGYRKLAQVYDRNDVQFRYLELDGEGLSLEALRRSEVQIVHTSPSHHFPTGIVMPIKRRRELLAWASEDDRYIIEDDYDCEFRFAGLPIPTLQSIDTMGKVIYLNTFSKTLTPSVRISYMVLPEHLLKLYRKKLGFYACTVSNFEQYTLEAFLREGYFEKHINRMRNYYRGKRDTVIRAIRSGALKKRIRVLEEDAGLHFLIRIDTELSDEEVKERLAGQGIRMKCLTDYSYCHNPFYTHMFVVNYSGVEEERLPEAMERLQKCI